MSLDEAFRVLGLSHNASQQEVRIAYVDLIKVWHPDRFGSDERLRSKAEKQVKLVNEAYQTYNSLITSTVSSAAYQSRTYRSQPSTPKPNATSEPNARPRNTTTSKPPTRQTSSSKDPATLSYRAGRRLANPFVRIVGIAILIFGGCYIVVAALSNQVSRSGQSSVTKPQSTVPVMPIEKRRLPNGTRIRLDAATRGRGILSIENDSSGDAVVKVTNLTSKRTVRYVYLQQGSTLDLKGFEQGEYRVRFTFGEDWDGIQRQFTRDQSYYEFGKTLEFKETELSDRVLYSQHTITLNTVVGGNVTREGISKEQFGEDQ